MAALARSGQPVVVVHGGGPQATELQKKLGQTPRIVAGRRITDAAALDAMKMVVAGKVNVELCAALLAAGARPVGLHGASCARDPRPQAAAARRRGRGPRAGRLRSRRATWTASTRRCSDSWPPRATSRSSPASAPTSGGNVYNINADIVANKVAVALGARALVLVSDVPGVLLDVNDPGSRIPRLTAAEGKAPSATAWSRRG